MTNKKITIKEATQKWVGEFNAISQRLIEKAYGGDNFEELQELTKVGVGDYVWNNDLQGEYEILSIDGERVILEDNGEKIEVNIDDIYNENRDGLLPMWGTMWTFETTLDSEWVLENLQTVSDLGFRIYEGCDDGEIYIGIDGAGYDFYEAHWIPLYKARGLQWHDIE